MFCIAAFIVLAILGIFSARYRQLAGRAWQCVIKKLTFKKCDINFAEEVKGKLLGRLIISHPGLARFLNKWIDFLALVFVVLSVWSLLYVAVAGLNLFVYDTCKPQSGQSCSLSGEACTIGRQELGFWGSVKANQEGTWLKQEFGDLWQTVSLVPSRLKSWDATKYLSPKPTYYYPFDQVKPVAIEIIDPGCKYCAELFKNIKQSGFENKYNLSYIVYPIQDPDTLNGWHFANSNVVASYLEAVKEVMPNTPVGNVAPDWQILEKIFTGKDSHGQPWQSQFNLIFNEQQATVVIQQFLKEAGYSESQIDQINTFSQSLQVKARLDRQREIVEKEVQTVKIPTILFGGRRYDRVIGADKLTK